jgi:hypothetical protein
MVASCFASLPELSTSKSTARAKETPKAKDADKQSASRSSEEEDEVVVRGGAPSLLLLLAGGAGVLLGVCACVLIVDSAMYGQM